MNDNSLAAWLYSATGSGDPVTVGDLMTELEGLRKGPTPERYDDLPKTDAECAAGLQRLSVAGRAVLVVLEGKQAWRWAEPSVVEVNKQGSLFE